MTSLDDDVVVVPAPLTERQGKGLGPTLASMARTLDISVRFLQKSLVGHASVELADDLLAGWAHDIFRYGRATLKARGLEHIHSDTSYVVMSNHGSLIDVPALLGTYPKTLRMVTKEELTRVPIWGRAMRASGFIPIDRKNRARAIEQLELAKQRLSEGTSVWIAPEGTRAERASLGPFRKGGFHLAQQLEVPILPAYVDGAATMLPNGAVRLRYGVTVSVTYGAPLAPSGDIAGQMARVRAAILELAAGRLVDGAAPR
ncbi:MAG: 1-acyl-sn-glycerol-3-phosphate acyltransferase [Myxococcales bacterium]|nr:1-acyl-sn-glycerol-3-phosphate acyltransferase [Myxococcales bacterium]